MIIRIQKNRVYYSIEVVAYKYEIVYLRKVENLIYGNGEQLKCF
jgi:hypothetical protein